MPGFVSDFYFEVPTAELKEHFLSRAHTHRVAAEDLLSKAAILCEKGFSGLDEKLVAEVFEATRLGVYGGMRIGSGLSGRGGAVGAHVDETVEALRARAKWCMLKVENCEWAARHLPAEKVHKLSLAESDAFELTKLMPSPYGMHELIG